MLKKPLVVRALSLTVAVVAALFGVALPAAAAPSNQNTDPGIQIVGGTPATNAWTVSLQDVDPDTGLNRHRCGGTLIHPRWVMTAAHCTSVIVPGGKARIGSLEWKTGGTLATIQAVFIHPNYAGLFENDIALVKLAQPVNEKRFPPFPLGKVGVAGSTGLAAGWGTTCDLDITDPACRFDIPDILQQLLERRLPNEECSLVDPTEGEVFNPANMFCMVSADNQNRQACFRDSGSPIMQKNIFGVWTVVGIVIGDGDDAGAARPHLCSTGPSGGPGKVMLTNVGAHGHWIITTIVNN